VVNLEEKIIHIIVGMLKRMEGEPITQEKLVAIRSEVYKRTRGNKNAPFSNVKKWIKEARKMMRSEGKKEGKKKAAAPAPPARISESLQKSIDNVKADAHEIYVEAPKPKIVFDKVYLQNIQYDISGMRSALERMSKQLDRLEKELEEHRE